MRRAARALRGATEHACQWQASAGRQWRLAKQGAVRAMQYEGWVALDERFDDLGVSGGSLERVDWRG